MSETDPTGYGESPDTVDEPATGDPDAGAPADEDATTLTTDDEAQAEDGIVRPGNQPD